MHEAPLTGMRVLVLEDEILIAMDVEQQCRDLGAEDVTIARRLGEIDARFDAAWFGFAVLDISIDGDTGVDVATRLRDAGLPFVFATGYAETDGLFDAFPGVPVLSKPYTSEAFVKAVGSALGASRDGSGGV